MAGRDGPVWCSTKIRRRFPIWADGGYKAWQVDAAVAMAPSLPLATVKRSDDVKGFVVLPRRWVVPERFALASDWEHLVGA